MLLRLTLYFFIFLNFTLQAQPCREVVSYFPSWKWYSRKNLVNPATIDYSKYTAINYAFFQPDKDGSITPFDPNADKTLLLGTIKPTAPPGYVKWKDLGDKQWHVPGTSLVERAHREGVKVLISVGGWTLSANFSGIAANEEKRQRFAQSCNDLVRAYDLDGIDLDWEYPGFVSNGGAPGDKRNFSLLLQAVRDSLDWLEKRMDKPLQLTAAFGVAPTRMADIEWGIVAPLLDYINLMTYDFYGSTYSVTNHNSPLFAPGKGLEGFDLHSVVHHLMDRYNVPAEKINIGLAFYGRSMKTKGTPDLHTTSKRAPDSVTFPEDAGAPTFYNILARQSLFNYFWDSLAQVPYLKGKSSLNTFVTFEDENSIARKAQYILDHNLAGAIIWDITGDYVESRPGSGIVEKTPLSEALSAALCNKPPPEPGVAYVKYGLHKLPQRWSPVFHRTYPPRLVYKKELSKKELRKQKRRLKKEMKRKKKTGGDVPEKYFNGGW